MRIMTKNASWCSGSCGDRPRLPPLNAQHYGYSGPQVTIPIPHVRGTQYGYSGVNPDVATQQCSAAVQNRLSNRTSLGAILGSLVGFPTDLKGRVLSITQTIPTRNGMRIRELASSGRYARNNYGPYGAGAYGALGYGYNASADLS